MTLLTSLKDYAKRHRRGLTVTAVIAGGGYLAGKYATNKLKEYQEKSTTERLAKENLKRRFQQNQNDCVFTVLSLLPTLGDQILTEMNVEASWAQLQESRKQEKLVEKRKHEHAARKQQRKEEKEAKRLEAAAAAAIQQPTQEETDEAAEKDKQQDATVDQQRPGEQDDTKEQQDITATKSTSLEFSVGSLSDSGHTTGTGSVVMVDNGADQDDSDSDDDDDPVPVGLLDKQAKYLLWEDIKVTSFTRTLASMYSITLLTLLTHVQLNLLGRFTYVWSVSVLNKSEPTIRLQHEDDPNSGNGFLDPMTERMFLSTSWWLLHRGWRKCAERVKEAVDQVVGKVPLKSILTYQGTEELVNKLRKAIEYEEDGQTPFSFRSWMLPDTHEEELEFLRETGFAGSTEVANGTVTLQQLLDETKDFIDSPDFVTVLSCCLEEVYSIFDHNAFGKTLLPSPMDPSAQRIQEITSSENDPSTKKMTLANLLPAISRQAHLVIAGNEYLNGFTYLKELQAFSAMIYTQYGQEVSTSV